VKGFPEKTITKYERLERREDNHHIERKYGDKVEE